MTLADNILAAERQSYHRVTIANIPIVPFNPTEATGIPGIDGITYQASLDQPCPTCTLSTNRIATWIKRGYPVEVDLGFGGLNRRVFTGTVQQRGQPGVANGQIDCAGELWRLVRSTFDEVRDVGGLTVEQGIAAILDDVGIPEGDRDLTSVPAYTLKSDATIPPGTGMAQLQQLLDVDGLRIRETGSGQVIVARYEGAPSAEYFRQYTTDGDNIRILDGGVTENPNWYRTKVTVLGGRLADGSDATATVTLSDTSGAQPPLAAGVHIPEVFSIPLIWDTTQATEAATRLASEHAQVPQTFRMSIPLDPQLEIGMTLGVSAPEWNVSGNWLIWAVTHNVAADTTTVQLVGGPQFAGTINVNPIAAFTFKAENQPLGSQRYTFVTLDASASFQPDNVDETLTYDWSGDQDAADSPAIDSQTAVKFTTSIDPTAMVGDVLTVTLVVTNEAGLTATVTKQINITPEGTDSIVVAIAAALETRFGFSSDGGETWNFQTGTDITTCAVAPASAQLPQYAVFGRDNGQIYRTTDGCATAPTSVKSSNSVAIVDLKWDWRDPTKVWALDSECQLWVSTDYGATWAEIVDFRSSMSLSTIIGKRLFLHQDGYTYVGGGTGVSSNGRPFIGRFKSGTPPFGFASVFGGDLQTDLGSGSTNLAIADWHFDTTGGLIIVLENYTAYNSGVRPAYWCPDPMTPTGWKRIGSTEGLDSGVTTAGRVALPGNSGPGYYHLMFNDRDAWHINCSSGTPVATVTADFLDANFTPNEGLHMADETEGIPSADCHLIAVQDAGGNGAIVKSFDDMVTQADLLPGMTTWPDIGNAQGKDAAIGPPANLSTRAKIIIGGLLSTPTERFIAWREGQGNFEAHIFDTNLDADGFFRIRAITSDLWFVFWAPTDTTSDDIGLADAVRTEDGGATWDDLYAAPTDGGLTRAWQDIQRGADGRLWGLTCEAGGVTQARHMEIWYSDDDGDTWTESKDDTSDTTDHARIMHLVCHPTNPDRIAALGVIISGGVYEKIVTWFTTDGGANWTENKDTTGRLNSVSISHKQAGHMMLASNRMIFVGHAKTSNACTIWTSDDNGASWDSRKTFADSTSAEAERIYGPVGNESGTRLFVMVERKDVNPDDIQIWESTDQGTTWTQTVGDDLGNGPPQPDTTDTYLGGIAYDPTEGSIYLFGAGRDNTNNINHVVKTVGLGWQDVSDNLIGALTGHTAYSLDTAKPTTHGIVVIPS